MERNIQQEGRLLEFVSNAVFNNLIPTDFQGEEVFSDLFSFTISGYCKDINLRLSALFHQSVALQITDKNQKRLFHGVVAKIENLGVTAYQLRRFRLYLRPQIWFLNKIKNCEIYQHKTVLEIVTSILQQQGITAVNMQGLMQTYEPKPYCVQYNETSLEFIQRLLEEAGINYYFSFSKNKHTLHLVDNVALLPQLPNALVYSNIKQDGAYLYEWRSKSHMVTPSVSSNDFNYQRPEGNLHAELSHKLKQGIVSKRNRFYYPGDYNNQPTGQEKISLQLQRQLNEKEWIEGSGNIFSFSAGLSFQLKEHEDNSQLGQYFLTKVQHQAQDMSHLNRPTSVNNSSESMPSPTQFYENHFKCYSRLRPYQPCLKFPKPKIYGYHNAIVVGSQEKAIYTDKLGRIKVRFVWDYNSPYNETASCWIRVKQHQTGKGWGTHFLPRVGQAVLIGFQDGDIDRPICIGSVYNPVNHEPYPLPKYQHKSGIRTKSVGSMDQEQCHEIAFDDLVGHEKLLIQAQTQFIETINHNASQIIGNGHNDSVTGTKNIFIGGNTSYESPKQIELVAAGGSIIITPTSIYIKGVQVAMGEAG